MSIILNSPAPAEDQPKLLDEILSVVKVQAHQMKKCLDNNKLMDGLKHASNMLAELRTSALMPKSYYELYMAIFDALRHLTIFLTEAHSSGRHHLADLYELVQYAGNIVPRLYLMITVGAAYMSMPDAPVREIMRDMIEMSRGVQHPMRGLFLRYYLSSNTRDSLPVGESPGPEGNVHESIHFILTNFTEMNKLWVRLQHQGHTRDREKREAERKELRILVGTNLVRLSQLEGVDLRVYQSLILPGILDQIVSCRDIIAQEYLMEIITQVFPDEFHLRTLEPFLSATAQLHTKVNVKQIIIALIDRLAAYAAREAEAEVPVQTWKSEEEEARKAVIDNKKRIPENSSEVNESDSTNDVEKGETVEGDNEKAEEDAQNKSEDSEDHNDADNVPPTPETKQEEEKAKEEEEPVRNVRGIPEDVELFVVFWAQIVELVKARPDLSIQDLTALLVSLIHLSLSCYPDKLEYVDQILAYAKDKVAEHSSSPDLHSKTTEANLLSLLLAPIQEYTSVLTLLVLTNYQPLLALQSYGTRRAVAQAVISSIVKNETIISTPEDVQCVLDLCGVMLRDQKDAPMTSMATSQMYGPGRGRKAAEISRIEQDELAEEQGCIAKLIHLFRSNEEDTQFLLLSTARKRLSEGGSRIQYTFPALVISAAKLARRYSHVENKDDAWGKKIATLFRFMHQVISALHDKCECSELCLRLFLLAAQSADECGFEEMAYEFFVQAFTIYEESISESRAQFQAITGITSVLQQTRIFSADNYDTLITKTALHSAKLLKKPDQCRAVYLSSHLWWTNDREGEGVPYRSGKRVLECLQKALKIADSCMDAVMSVELFVEILNRYIYYFENGNEAVTAKYLNGLIDLINSNLSNMENPDQHPPASSSSSLVEHTGPASEYVIKYFHATIGHLRTRQEAAQMGDWQGPDYSEIDLGITA
ncbi:Vacuolar protein sorting-associated protein 35 [Apophysomyces ossiformis]|uniref:Vacuolar protein sorting-associated protein 35 n=1 Tax=Apophysomyces ossiformis TaxID=679940 RepID=A0A8H7BWI0_9FUNG|nr:Vacuolar protein sorting-associated protein 35 [Apophysomyces ossiformis]